MINAHQQAILRVLLHQSTDSVAIFQRVTLPKRYSDIIDELRQLLDMGLVETHLVRINDNFLPISFWSIKGPLESMQKLLLL